MLDPRHIWNVIYNARSNRCHPPTSQILRLPGKMTLKIFTSFPKNRWNVIYNAGTIRAQHDHFVLKTTHTSRPRQNFTIYCACHEKWRSNLTKSCAAATKQTLQPHQIVQHKVALETWPNAAPATRSGTWLCYSLTILLLDDSFTFPGRFYYLTSPLLDDILLLNDFFYVSWRFYYLTVLLLDESITWRYSIT